MRPAGYTQVPSNDSLGRSWRQRSFRWSVCSNTCRPLPDGPVEGRRCVRQFRGCGNRMTTLSLHEGGDEVYLERLTLAETLPCLADPSRCVVVGRPSRPIAPVLPYVNGVLPNVISYAPAAGIMTLRRKPGFITIYPDKVYITQVQDAAEGQCMLDALAELINKIWARREQIVPATAPRRGPRMLDVWKLLPRSNCKRCGLPTCMAFAVGLLLATSPLASCAALAEPKAAGQRSALIALLNLEAPSS